MNQRSKSGVTLLEIMVVIAIMAIMLAIAVPIYSKWNKRYRAENSIKLLYSNLQWARINSYVEKKAWGLYWGSSNPFKKYQIRKDGNGDGDIRDSADVVVKEVNLPFRVSHTTSRNYVVFDERGFCTISLTLYINDQSISPEYSCIKISKTRIRMGSWNGTNCIIR